MGNNKFGYGTSLRSFTIPSDKRTLSVSAGQTVTLRLLVTYYSYTGAVGGAGQCQAPITYTRSSFTYGVSAAQYVCRYSTNGLMLNGSNNKFFGFNNTATNNENEVLLARSGNFGMSLMNKGLMLCTFSGTTITRYRMNPLVFVGRFTPTSGTYNCSPLFNPFGVYSNREKVQTGKVKIMHNLNHTNYCVSGVGFVNNSQCFVSVHEYTSSYVIVGISWNGSMADHAFELRIFDYGQY